MGLIASSKGMIVKTVLDKLSHGDSGSTALGVAAAAIMLANPNYTDLFSTDENKRVNVIATIAVAAGVALWGYFVGKKKPVMATVVAQPATGETK